MSELQIRNLNVRINGLKLRISDLEGFTFRCFVMAIFFLLIIQVIVAFELKGQIDELRRVTVPVERRQ
jgi:hypothetical protein